MSDKDTIKKKKRKNKHKKHKKQRTNKLALVIGIIFAILVAIGVGLFFYIDSLAYKRVRLEAGHTITGSDIMKKGDAKAFFTMDSDDLSITTPGSYKVVVKSGLFKHKSTIIVEDTIAPTADAVNQYCSIGDALNATDFISNLRDATATTVTFSTVPDFNTVGTKKVDVVITDLGGNKTIVTSSLTVLPFKTSIVVEAGSRPLQLEDFRLSSESYSCSKGFDDISMSHVGHYKLAFAYEGNEYDVTVDIADSIEPTVTFNNYSGFYGEKISARDFVVSANDVTNLDYRLESEPLDSAKQDITVIVTDEGGNSVSKVCSLELKTDDEAPVINEVTDIEVYEGNAVSYMSGISVSDNCMKALDIKVDAEGVDTSVPGTYPIKYTITDVGGHTLTASTNVIVKARDYSMDEVNAAADEILARITTPDMSDYDKAYAIFKYVKGNVIFKDKSDKDSYVKACYEGVIGKSGDCYVYACTCQTLLTRAGIKNMMIERIPTRTTHFWNLVDYGEGWYHFDTTPQLPDHPNVFMWTEAQLQAHSATHWRCYNYDHSQYPVTN